MPSKLKRFGGASDRMEQLGKVKGLTQAANALDAPISADSGEMRLVPIDEVRVDPNNPRRLELDWTVVQQSPEDIEDPRKRREVEDILGLSLTFKQVGQRSPCEVVRDGAVYRIVFGERRYWAARLAELSTLKVIALHSQPANVPLVQLIENIQHKHMPLYETILNIRSVIGREAELGEPVRDATDLIQRTGLPRTSAYRYWKYVELPPDVDQSLETAAIGTHEELTALLKHTTVKARKAALTRFAAGGTLEGTDDTEATAKPKRRRGGRPRTSISFGSTKNASVAKLLFSTLDPDGHHDAIDWNDATAVTNAWKSILEGLEQRATREG